MGKKRPFEKVWVIVPSQAVKNFLKTKISEALGICMGVEFLFLQPAIGKMIQLCYPQLELESHVELALKLQLIITKNIEDPQFLELKNYLVKNKSSSQIDSSKLTSFCDHLASEFVTYSLYVPSMEDAWQKNFEGHWQQKIWKELFSEKSYIKDPYQVLNQSGQKKGSVSKIFFFNLSFMPRSYFELLLHLSSIIQMEFFQVSPCSFFWSDIQNDFERSLFLRKMRKSSKSESEIEELKEYLLEAHPLLANWGKLGREWLKLTEEKELESSERYFIPSEAFDHPRYSKWIDPSKEEALEEPLTLLKGVQSDVLLMQSEGEALNLDEAQSIQVHQVSTYEREVEILHQNLLALFESDQTLKPSDVVVYVAHIENYIPYIEHIFSKSSYLEAIIHDQSISFKNETLKAIFLFFELMEAQGDQKKLLELFHTPAFKSRFNLPSEVLQKWENWMSEIGPCWGYSREDQAKYLESQYQQKMKVEEPVIPSWEDFVETVVKYLCQERSSAPLMPYLKSIDFSSSDDLNLFIEILENLKGDFKALSSEKMQFSEWASFFSDLVGKYFLFGGRGAKRGSKNHRSGKALKFFYRKNRR